MGSIDRATLLAATRATNPAAILRPIATTSSSSLMPLSVLKNNDKSVTKNVAPKTTTSKRQTSKKATKEKLTTPIIHNFCKDLPTSDNVFGANKEIEVGYKELYQKANNPDKRIFAALFAYRKLSTRRSLMISFIINFLGPNC
jgi:hypothetical protein